MEEYMLNFYGAMPQNMATSKIMEKTRGRFLGIHTMDMGGSWNCHGIVSIVVSGISGLSLFR
jgi:hypothetical protein